MNKIATASISAVCVICVAIYVGLQHKTYVLAKVQTNYVTAPNSSQPQVSLKNGESEVTSFQLVCYPGGVINPMQYEPRFAEFITLAPNEQKQIALLPSGSKSDGVRISRGDTCIASLPLVLGVKKLVWKLVWRDESIGKEDI